LYHLPYQVYSPQDLTQLHILILEAEGLALELKEQLEVWGFSSVEMAHDHAAFRQREKRKIALALLDAQTLHLFPLGRQLHLLVHLLAVPLIVMLSYVGKHKGRLWRLLKYPLVLQKPFSASQLREAMERGLHIALLAQTDKNQ
jgi:DNA-binding transcriptional MerR regulator